MQVFETSSRVLGHEHSSTLTSMANLASTYWNRIRKPQPKRVTRAEIEVEISGVGVEHAVEAKLVSRTPPFLNGDIVILQPKKKGILQKQTAYINWDTLNERTWSFILHLTYSRSSPLF